MANQYVNKVVVGAEVKLDLSQDTISPDKLAKTSPPTTSPVRPSWVPALWMWIPPMPQRQWRKS